MREVQASRQLLEGQVPPVEFIALLDCCARIVENELAACDAAIDVVCGSMNEKARVSWHEIALMRGRDTLSLAPQSQTMQ